MYIVLTPRRLPTDLPPETSDMNCTADPLPLVDIIQLKWLLAGVGIHIHVERLLNDPGYAVLALAEAEQCDSPAARAAASKLRSRLTAPR